MFILFIFSLFENDNCHSFGCIPIFFPLSKSWLSAIFFSFAQRFLCKHSESQRLCLVIMICGNYMHVTTIFGSFDIFCAQQMQSESPCDWLRDSRCVNFFGKKIVVFDACNILIDLISWAFHQPDPIFS